MIETNPSWTSKFEVQNRSRIGRHSIEGALESLKLCSFSQQAQSSGSRGFLLEKSIGSQIGVQHCAVNKQRLLSIAQIKSLASRKAMCRVARTKILSSNYDTLKLTASILKLQKSRFSSLPLSLAETDRPATAHRTMLRVCKFLSSPMPFSSMLTFISGHCSVDLIK